MAKNISPGDAVFIPSFTFAATAEVVVLLRATPIFVDIDADSYLMDIQSLEGAVVAAKAHGLTPRAVIPVDLFGQPAPYEAIQKLADTTDLWVLADAAQSFGASRFGKRVGSLAPITATSFFPSKPLGGYGDGGAIFTDDITLIHHLYSLRVHGQGKDSYENVNIGINGRLDTLQAAILLEKLKILDAEIRVRQRIAERYHQGLKDVAVTPVVADGSTSVWAQYTIRLRDRDPIATALKKQGIPTAVYYPIPLHRQSAYERFPHAAGGLEVSERLAREVLSLPIHPYLEEVIQDQIITAVRKAIIDAGRSW
jgi:dTDP-4-amino-4,6-dideoxygalactose transaminase